jgi:hypothetical protein
MNKSSKTYAVISYHDVIASDPGYAHGVDILTIKDALKLLHATMKEHTNSPWGEGVNWTAHPSKAHTFKSSDGMTIALETWYNV